MKLRRLLRPMRPALQTEVESFVAPVYARRDDVEREVADILRLVEEAADGATEADTVIGRTLSTLVARVDALEAEVARLRGEREAT